MWHRWFREARAGHKGAAVRSKRQHPLRPFASAVVAAAAVMVRLVEGGLYAVSRGGH
jgi:hypothetical protein